MPTCLSFVHHGLMLLTCLQLARKWTAVEVALESNCRCGKNVMDSDRDRAESASPKAACLSADVFTI